MGYSSHPRTRAVIALCACLSLSGCGNGVDESEFARNPGTIAPDAPKSPAEYDAKYPVANAGDRPAARGRGSSNVTNP